MFRHYLKMAVRNLVNQKFYALINILGLSIGLAAWLLITLYVMGQLAYDRFHERADRIYRVNYSAKLSADGDRYTIGATPPPVARILATEFPEIERATRIYPKGSQVVRYGDQSFTEEGVLAVDSNFFQIFSFQLKQGNPATVFREPNCLIVTESTARKYFGSQSAMGKTLLLGNARTPYTVVVGVVENPPRLRTSPSAYSLPLPPKSRSGILTGVGSGAGWLLTCS